MEPMTKERLERYIGLKIQTENLTERIARAKSEAMFPPMREADESKRQPGGSDRMGAATLRYMEVEDLLADSIEANKTEMAKIMRAILSLGDPIQADIMIARYTDDNDGKRLTWEEVTDKVYRRRDYDDTDRTRTVRRKHDEALIELEKVVI